MAKNQHDEMNDKTTSARPNPHPPAASPPATQRPVAVGRRLADDPEPDKDHPAGEFSTTARAEALPPPRPAADQAGRKDAEAKVASLQKEYDDTLAQIRDGRGDPAQQNQLVRRKGAITRKIDALRRGHGIK